MIDDLHSLGDLFSDPNGPAYQKTETRTGPPLEYVAEKLRSCLCDLHGLHGHIELDEVRDDWAAPGPMDGELSYGHRLLERDGALVPQG
jgi:hypothetical protein